MEELIDVLNENGNKTGEILTREEIHKRGLWHKIIVVCIIDANGHILMQQRAKNKETNPGKWDVSAAGHVSSGQTSIVAALREIEEELGLKVCEEELNYIFTYKYSKKENENFMDNEIFDCYIIFKENIDVENIKVQVSEVEQVKLCDANEFNMLRDNNKLVDREKLYDEIKKYFK